MTNEVVMLGKVAVETKGSLGNQFTDPQNGFDNDCNSYNQDLGAY